MREDLSPDKFAKYQDGIDRARRIGNASEAWTEGSNVGQRIVQVETVRGERFQLGRSFGRTAASSAMKETAVAGAGSVVSAAGVILEQMIFPSEPAY
jgi:hypothetical protein